MHTEEHFVECSGFNKGEIKDEISCEPNYGNSYRRVHRLLVDEQGQVVEKEELDHQGIVLPSFEQHQVDRASLEALPMCADSNRD